MSALVAFRKTSLVDYPGRVAAALFLPGCDFRCPYCHNAALVERPEPGAEGAGLVPLEDFLAFLASPRRLISGVAVSGGEPLLHPDLPQVIRAIREAGLALKLDTNGSLPSRIEEAGADYVALDLKTVPEAYARVAPGLPEAAERVLESLAILRRLSRAGRFGYELRITCAPGIFGPEEAEALAELLEPGDPVYLQAFRPGGCLDPAWDELEPYPAAVMEGLRAALSDRAPLTRIRGA